jgi:hypothetical protein
MTRVWAHGSETAEATAGAFQTTFGGGAFDVFVSKLNRSGSERPQQAFFYFGAILPREMRVEVGSGAV